MPSPLHCIARRLFAIDIYFRAVFVLRAHSSRTFPRYCSLGVMGSSSGVASTSSTTAVTARVDWLVAAWHRVICAKLRGAFLRCRQFIADGCASTQFLVVKKSQATVCIVLI